jgi:hypothetical protein
MTRKFLIIFPILLEFAAMPVALASMPTAALPIEPASSDKDLFGSEVRSGTPAPVAAAPLRKPSSASPASGPVLHATQPSGFAEFGTVLRMQMSKDGFGAQLKGLQYASSWLGVSETLRYFGNEGDERLFNKRYGFLLGIEVHPWKQLLVSPFVTLQAGWERFTRENPAPTIDSYMAEATAGLEMALGRYASLSAQWTEDYYADVDEALFVDQKGQSGKDVRRHALAEVFFNLRWTY